MGETTNNTSFEETIQTSCIWKQETKMRKILCFWHFTSLDLKCHFKYTKMFLRIILIQSFLPRYEVQYTRCQVVLKYNFGIYLNALFILYFDIRYYFISILIVQHSD